MASKIMKCLKCDKYTLEKFCCGENTVGIKPAKYRVDDKYGEYRRKAKIEDVKNVKN